MDDEFPNGLSFDELKPRLINACAGLVCEMHKENTFVNFTESKQAPNFWIVGCCKSFELICFNAVGKRFPDLVGHERTQE